MAMKNKRVVLDCRQHPQASKNCSLAISGTEDEVLELAMYHASSKHDMQNNQQAREQMRSMMKEEAFAH